MMPPGPSPFQHLHHSAAEAGRPSRPTTANLFTIGLVPEPKVVPCFGEKSQQTDRHPLYMANSITEISSG